MKLTISETITKEAELTLPCWRKSPTAYFYITEGFHIEVMNIHDWVHIGTGTTPPFSATNEESKAITNEEFQQAYEEAIKKLNEKLKVEVRYEFQIVEGSIYIDEIVNEKANRQFKISFQEFGPTAKKVIESWYEDQNEEINEDHIMLEDFAMFHRDKWEEVQP